MRELSCEETELLLAAHAVGDESEIDAGRLQAHLDGCASCRAAATAFGATAGLLPLALEPISPPERLRSTLMATVHAEARRAPALPRRSRAARLWDLVPSGRGFTVATAVASVAAVALGVMALGRPSSPVPPPVAATNAVVQLTGTPGQPAAGGTLSYNGPDHIAVITVSGLPDIQTTGAAARTYEVWVQPRGSTTMTAAGFLGHIPNTDVWSAAMPMADVHAYALVAATVEPIGGSATPSGSPLLTGRIPAV